MDKKSFRNRIKVDNKTLKLESNNSTKRHENVECEKGNIAKEEIKQIVLNTLEDEINRIASDPNINKEKKLIQIDYLFDICKFAENHEEAVKILNKAQNKIR